MLLFNVQLVFFPQESGSAPTYIPSHGFRVQGYFGMPVPRAAEKTQTEFCLSRVGKHPNVAHETLTHAARVSLRANDA